MVNEETLGTIEGKTVKEKIETVGVEEVQRKRMRIKTLLFDVSGVIGDARGTVSWKIKVAMEEARLDEIYGIGFYELMNAYSLGGWDSLWERYSVKEKDVGKYMQTWSAIQEYPPGSVRIYPEVPFVFDKLLEANINICLLTRLTNQNVENVLDELKRRGFKGEEKIKVFNPQTEDEQKKDKKFVEKVLYKACSNTLSPKAYVGDELDRGPQLRIFDEDILVIGSARGFFSVKNLETAYYKRSGNGFIFQNFDERSRALSEGYQKVFDDVITSLEDLLTIIDREWK